tara:strand:+ start:406 stop:528 length:123 start_codon:yes stop_codon:yes gene_type:complete
MNLDLLTASSIFIAVAPYLYFDKNADIPGPTGVNGVIASA